MSPPDKDPPIFRCPPPPPLCPVVSNLRRDILVSHDALLTGPDLECPHTNVLFMYHPPYFYIPPPLRHKWSIYLMWIGRQHIFVMTLKGKKESQKRQKFPSFYLFFTPLWPHLKGISLSSGLLWTEHFLLQISLGCYIWNCHCSIVLTNNNGDVIWYNLILMNKQISLL